MSAHVHTLTIVAAACDADPGVSPAARTRVLEILRTGVSTPTTAAWLSEREAAACIGLHKSTLNRWRRGLYQDLGAFPFHLRLDATHPRSRYLYPRDEVTAYVHATLTKGA